MPKSKKGIVIVHKGEDFYELLVNGQEVVVGIKTGMIIEAFINGVNKAVQQ